VGSGLLPVRRDGRRRDGKLKFDLYYMKNYNLLFDSCGSS